MDYVHYRKNVSFKRYRNMCLSMNWNSGSIFGKISICEKQMYYVNPMILWPRYKLIMHKIIKYWASLEWKKIWCSLWHMYDRWLFGVYMQIRKMSKNQQFWISDSILLGNPEILPNKFHTIWYLVTSGTDIGIDYGLGA